RSPSTGYRPSGPRMMHLLPRPRVPPIAVHFTLDHRRSPFGPHDVLRIIGQSDLIHTGGCSGRFFCQIAAYTTDLLPACYLAAWRAPPGGGRAAPVTQARTGEVPAARLGGTNRPGEGGRWSG